MPINIGNAFNLADGYFTAPIGGVYFFTFTSSTAKDQTDTSYVWVRKNNERLFIIHEGKGNSKWNNVSESWMLSLQAGDKINLHVVQGKMYADTSLHTFFTGQLIKPQ